VNKDPKKDTKGYILTGTQNDNYHNIKEGVECLLYRCKQCLDGKVVDDKQNKQKKEKMEKMEKMDKVFDH
jgi:hypothetical protein